MKRAPVDKDAVIAAIDAGMTYLAAGKKFGVSAPRIAHIVNGKPKDKPRKRHRGRVYDMRPFLRGATP